MAGWRAVTIGFVSMVSASLTATAVPGALPSAAAADPTSVYVAAGPFRLADTREADCGCTRLDAHTVRVRVAGRSGLPGEITAAAVTVTAVGGGRSGFVTAFPSGSPRPGTSVVNVRAGTVAANSTVVAVGEEGSIDVYVLVETEVVVDVTGVFVASGSASAGRFVATGPQRLLDTRDVLAAGIDVGGTVRVPLPPGVAVDASAVAVNVTSVGDVGPGFVSGGPANAPLPSTSFLNPDGTGRARAASVILPVDAQGLVLRTTSGGHLIVDLVGWFTGAGAPVGTDGLYTPVGPTRVVDTRVDAPRVWPGGEREVASPVVGAAALVTNITLDRTDGGGFVTAHAAGTPLPPTSSLNAPARDTTVANLAITSVSDRGLAYFSSGGTDVIVDVTGFFTGTPITATLAARPNVMPVHRVLMVGDSTLGALEVVTATRRALTGFSWVLDAKNCRRLVAQGCTSDYTKISPSTVVEAIAAAPGTFDIVVIKAGYNDPLTPFVPAVDAIVGAARAKGASTVVWFTFSDSDSAYVANLNANNATLRSIAGSVAYPDLVVADWHDYAAPSTGWYVADRRHLTALGAWATADYIGRFIAHLDRRPCPKPWVPGGVIDAVCPNPDEFAVATGTLPALQAIHGF